MLTAPERALIWIKSKSLNIYKVLVSKIASVCPLPRLLKCIFLFRGIDHSVLLPNKSLDKCLLYGVTLWSSLVLDCKDDFFSRKNPCAVT